VCVCVCVCMHFEKSVRKFLDGVAAKFKWIQLLDMSIDLSLGGMLRSTTR